MFLTGCKIILDNRFGFVKNKGSTEALHYVSNIIYNSNNKSEPTILDLAKPFDTVDHKIVLDTE